MIRGLGVEKNVGAGLRIVKDGLAKGFGSGYSVLGYCYRHVCCVKKDISQAVRYYSLGTACIGGSRGIRDAHLALAGMFENSDHATRNEEVASHHYLVAANKMSELAQWKTGTLFLSGSGGLEVHHNRAFVYFDLSARNGFCSKATQSSRTVHEGSRIQRYRSKAVYLLEEAIQRGDTEAKRLLFLARFSSMLLGNE